MNIATSKSSFYLMTSYMISYSILCYMIIGLVVVEVVEGHGYIKTPRSRNLVAYEDRVWYPQTANDPEPEDCPHCLNRGGSRARCGLTENVHTGGIRNYDTPKNALGGMMPTKIQATYTQGQEIVLDIVLTAHHKGHFVFSGCPISSGEVPTQDCFDQHKLTFVEDLLHDGNYDPNYPERAYLAPINSANYVPNMGAGSIDGGMEYSYKMRLPPSLHGDLVLIQWYYLTANSCYHEGYEEYDWPSGWRGGTSSLPCGSVSSDGTGAPEQFWNCAEVRIQYDPNVVIPPPSPPPTPQEIISSVSIPVSLPSQQQMSSSNINSQSSAGSHGKTIVGYYASWQWYDRNKKAAPENMDFTKVQRVNFAFFQINELGQMWGTDAWGDPNLLFGPYNWNPQPGSKQYCSWDSATEKVCNTHFYEQGLIHLVHQAGAEIYPSLGGWTLSDPFPAMAANPAARATFAQNCVDLIKEYDFDGIDIDWEYPSFEDHSGTPQDRENFKLLLNDVRARLDELGAETGRFYGLTAALPCGPNHIANMDIAHVASTLSELNLMTYDFHGSWSKTTGTNAPLYHQGWGEEDFDLHNCVKNWIKGGGSPSAINIGLPFYGRSFGSATGLDQPHSGADKSKWSLDDGTPQYFNIVDKLPQMTSVWDEKTWTQYAYFDSGGLVSFDNEAAICAKVEYAIDHDLGGFIIWELSGDLMDDLSTPLLDVTNKKLNNPSFNCGETGQLPEGGVNLPESGSVTATDINPTQVVSTPITYPIPDSSMGFPVGGKPVSPEDISQQLHSPPTNESPLLFVCDDQQQNIAEDSSSLDVAFRYELTRDSSVSIAEALRELKSSMMNSISDHLKCATLSNRKLRSNALETSQEYVKAIESTRSDLPQNVPCSIKLNIGSTQCQTVIGSMAVTVDKDTSPEVLSEIMNELLFFIRTSMAAGKYDSQNIRKVIYVDTLSVDPLKSTNLDANMVWQPESGNSSTTIIAVVLSLIIFILLGTLLFVLVAKKRNRVSELTTRAEDRTFPTNTNPLDPAEQMSVEDSLQKALNTEETWKEALRSYNAGKPAAFALDSPDDGPEITKRGSLEPDLSLMIAELGAVDNETYLSEAKESLDPPPGVEEVKPSADNESEMHHGVKADEDGNTEDIKVVGVDEGEASEAKSNLHHITEDNTENEHGID